MGDEGEGVDGGRRCVQSLFWNRSSLLVIMIAYAFFGAILFKTLEGDEEGPMPVNVQRSREDCLRELWLITERLNVLYEKNWTRLVTEQLKRFERAVTESGKREVNGGTVGSRWTFSGALLYSITLLTTVGYGRLSPRTAIGKVVAIIYALIGVPLMLVLLSVLGSMLACGARKIYLKLCCIKSGREKQSARSSPSVGYQKAPPSPSGGNKHYYKSYDDTASIQISGMNCKMNHYVEEVPKRALLATVRASHARGRCRQGPVRQMLAEAALCPAHSHSANSTPVKSRLLVSAPTSDVEEAEDTDENDHVLCTHDTPSRVPLIWRPTTEVNEGSPTMSQESNGSSSSSPSVPAVIVLFFFVSYVAVGAFTFASTSGWSLLDATYFCFIALSTIGVGDKLPNNNAADGQMQIFACCAYLVVGLVIVAMCFTLVHEELTLRCKKVANDVGFLRH